MAHPDQEVWLAQHIPFRLRTCLSGLSLQSELVATITNENVRDSILYQCLSDTVWEGRMASIRWLIEFVGIRDFNGKPGHPKLRKTDVSISFIQGGKPIDPSSRDGAFLASVWNGCSQASGRRTQDKNHPPVDPETLDKALRIIVRHLKHTIYSNDPDKLVALMLARSTNR